MPELASHQKCQLSMAGKCQRATICCESRYRVMINGQQRQCWAPSFTETDSRQRECPTGHVVPVGCVIGTHRNHVRSILRLVLSGTSQGVTVFQVAGDVIKILSQAERLSCLLQPRRQSRRGKTIRSLFPCYLGPFHVPCHEIGLRGQKPYFYLYLFLGTPFMGNNRSGSCVRVHGPIVQ
jgi:hypothetical protein